MISTRKNKAILVLILALVMSVLAPFVMQVNNYAKAGGEVKTVSEVTFSMDKGASIYNGSGEYASKKGVKFSASMSEQDYIDLTNNVGVDKLYSSLMFGVIIAPSSYETTYGKFNETTLFGIVGGQKSGTAIYDWAEWDGEKWNYSGTKTRVINIERNELSIDTGKAVCKGSITTILDENLLNAFKGVCYIVAEKNDGGYDCAFATENDNVRTVVYVAQQRQQAIKDEIAKLDPTENAQAIAELNAESDSLGTTYIKDTVTNQSVNYTVNHYYEKPNGGYFLYEKTTKSANVNSALSAETEKVLNIPGVTFDSDNANNTKQTVALAQDKSVVDVYYDVEYSESVKEEIFNISSTEDFAVGDDIINVYTADMEKISDNNVVANSSIVDMGKGEHYLYVLTANGFEKRSAIMATHVISTADEFVDFFESFNTNTICTNTKYWYAVVTDDIDMSAKTLPSKLGWWYCGTFNGLGHEVSGIKPKDGYGMFGGLTNTAVIENLAFTNISTVYNLISNEANGTLRNLFVQGEIKFDGYTRRGIVVLESMAKVENCIVDAKTPSSGTAANYAFKYNGGTIDDSCYIASESLLGFAKNSETSEILGVLESNMAELLENAIFIADISAGATNGWSKYWKKDTIGLWFGDYLISVNENLVPTETKETAYVGTYVYNSTSDVYETTTTAQFDLSEIVNVEDIDVLFVDGEMVDATEIITIDLTDRAVNSEMEILIGIDGEIIKQPIQIATHVMSTADEFVAFFNSFNNSTTCNSTAKWYAVVTEDITINSTDNMPDKTSKYFKGHFNGLGHTVSGVKPNSAFGIFGELAGDAIIENIGFTGISTAYYLFSHSAIDNTIIRNVYVQGELKYNSTHRGVVKLISATAKMENCVVDAVVPSSGTAGSFAIQYSNGTVTNSYAIGTNLKGFAGSGSTDMEKGKKYTIMSDFIAEQAVNINSTNGWSEYWKLTGDATNGYTLKFGNVTVGSTVNA